MTDDTTGAGSPPDAAAEGPAGPSPKPKKKRPVLRALVVLLILGVLAAGAAIGGAAYLFFRGEGPAQDMTLVIPRGASLGAMGRQLEDAGAVTSRHIFMAGVFAHRAERALKAGEYFIPAHITMAGVMAKLRAGDTVVRRLTVAEGLSVAQIMAQLEADDTLSGALGAPPPEGTLLPETYHYSLGDRRAEIVRRMRLAMDKALAALWPGRAPGLPFDQVRDAVILASIVEKETAIASERAHIAGVFVNRLRRGMALQSDPTIVYGLTGGTPLGRPLRQSELDRKTPYNTYHFTGLPPTPIANPGRAALRAVLHPLETQDLYFVADGTGGHAFARTYREHQANVRKWRRLER